MGKKKNNRTRSTAPKRPTNPVEAEAADEGIEFGFRGVQFRTLPALDMSVDILDAADSGNGLTAVRLMLGDEEWNRFRELRPTLRDLAEFAEALASASGLGSQGN
ncbi:hypothetical protein [Yinghuangia sp. YIM S09857]|uniref:hypothetical protein n=1 Tax=Yinghuangia sp. YIM S09857 TaxID=3436929 RepID=UPI003F52F0C8